MLKIFIFIVITLLYIVCARYNSKHKISNIYTFISAILLVFQLLGILGEFSSNIYDPPYSSSTTSLSTMAIIGNIAEYIGFFFLGIVALLVIGIPSFLKKKNKGK